MIRYSGRDFTPKEIKQIRSLIKQNPGFNRMRLSKEVCQMFQWLKPDGNLKDMSCRVAMLRMQKDGAKYFYLSDELSKNKNRQMQVLPIDIEKYSDRKVNIPDLVAVLKVALAEYQIDMNNLKKLIIKYSLQVPINQIEQLLLKYDLSSKKKH